MITVTRYHDICMGHRVYGHENKCKNLHGHNYRFYFELQSSLPDCLDEIGRVVDFSIIKESLCYWLELNWDHRMIMWENDPLSTFLKNHTVDNPQSIVIVPFNPTAENIAIYMVRIIAPPLLKEYDIFLKKCTVQETRKCSASYEIDAPIHLKEEHPLSGNDVDSEDYLDLPF